MPRWALQADSRWTIPVAVSLLDRRDTNLDEYAGLLEQSHYYAAECVTPDGASSLFQPCSDGHYYD